MKKGFTLIELLAVILIIGIIALIAMPIVNKIVKESKISSFKSDAFVVIKTIELNNLKEGNIIETKDDLKKIGIKSDSYEVINIGKSNGELYLEMVGKNQWNGYVACGTYDDIKIVKSLEECKIISPSLILHIPMEGNADDISGNGHNGIVLGASIVDGKYGQAYSFDGVDDYIRIPLVLTNNEFSVSAWIYHNEYTQDGDAIIGNSSWNTWFTKGFVIRFWKSNTSLSFVFGNSTTGSNKARTIPMRMWSHVAATYDGETYKIYVDGNLTTSENFTYSVPTNTIRIGSDFTNSGDVNFNGIIDDVQIYSKALEIEDIKRVMNNLNPLNG